MRRSAIVMLSLTLLTAGCVSSRWKYVGMGLSGRAVTVLHVRTAPAGAEISIDGNYQGKSPIDIPVRYPYVVRLYERREALPYPHIKERKVKVFEHNVFRLEAILVDYEPASEPVEVHGEEEKEVEIILRAR